MSIWPAERLSGAPGINTPGRIVDGNFPTTGWRFWTVDGNQLIGPFSRDPLPHNGVAVADCIPEHRPPQRGCECGLYFWPTTADALVAIEILGLHEPDAALTYGDVIGPVLPDPRPLTRVRNQWMAGPPALRCRSFAVQAILTNATTDLAYDIPVHPLDDLTSFNSDVHERPRRRS